MIKPDSAPEKRLLGGTPRAKCRVRMACDMFHATDVVTWGSSGGKVEEGDWEDLSLSQKVLHLQLTVMGVKCRGLSHRLKCPKTWPPLRHLSLQRLLIPPVKIM